MTRKTIAIVACGFLIVALAIPAFANGGSYKGSEVTKVGGAAYKGGAKVLDTTANVVNGCLKNSFSIFNPCLDVVKACTDRVLYPLDKGFGYVETVAAKSWPMKKAPKVQVPKKGAAEK